jgi:antitoxin ParD1/3/4
MAEGVNVRFAGELHRFIQSRVVKSGLYNSASEYVRDLVRRDYEREEQRKWSSKHAAELDPSMEATKVEFVAPEPAKAARDVKSSRKVPGRPATRRLQGSTPH